MHGSYAGERHYPGLGCPTMEQSREYQQLAEECERLAQQAGAEDLRRTLKKMAAAWRKVAEEHDREHLSRAR